MERAKKIRTGKLSGSGTVYTIETTWGERLIQLGSMRQVGEGTRFAKICPMTIHLGRVGA